MNSVCDDDGAAINTHKKSFLWSISEYLKKFFMDLRLVSVLMTIWLIIVILIMIEIGIFSNSSFVAFGPRKELSFIKVPIDTYYKYNMLIVMIISHTFITDFIADSLSPHVLNVVQDPKTKYIPHKPYTYFGVTTIWAVYCSITQLFAIFIAFAQLDLLLVRLISDVCANLVTTNLYLHGKEYNPTKYKIIEMKQNHYHSHPGTLNEEMHDLTFSDQVLDCPTQHEIAWEKKGQDTIASSSGGFLGKPSSSPSIEPRDSDTLLPKTI